MPSDTHAFPPVAQTTPSCPCGKTDTEISIKVRPRGPQQEVPPRGAALGELGPGPQSMAGKLLLPLGNQSCQKLLEHPGGPGGGVGRGYLAPLLRTWGPETPYWLQSLLIHSPTQE